MNFFSELKRRNVFKVGAAYLVVAWLLLQLLAILLPTFNAPDWVMQVFVLILGVGFIITLFIAWAFELTPEGIRPTAKVVEETDSIPGSTQKLNHIIIGGLSLVLVLVLVDSYLLPGELSSQTTPNPATAQTQTVNTAANVDALEKSIAVLPFSNLSSDAEQEYFSDGLSEELLNKLAQVDDLLVAARTSSFFYKGRNEDIQTIASQLGVNYLLEGSVRRAGDQLRVSAQLIQANNGFELWSDTYERQLEDVFAVQDEIAEAVSTALRVTLGTDQFALPGRTRNAEAWDAYLKAMQFEQFLGTPADVLAGLQAAVRLDPGFALAWFQMASSYGNQAIFFSPQERQEELANLRYEAMETARNLAPDMPELITADFRNMFENREFAEAENLILTSIETNSTNDQLNREYGNFLMEVGRYQDAIPYLQRAIRLDPLNLASHALLARVYLFSNRPEEAEAMLARMESIQEGSLNVGRAVAVRWGLARARGGNRAWAEAQLADVQNVDNAANAVGNFNRSMAELLLMEDRVAAFDQLASMIRDPQTPVFLRGAMSNYAIWLADENDQNYDLAFEALEGTNYELFGDFTKELRPLPRFKDLVRDRGYLNYFLESGNWNDFCRPIPGGDDFECF